MSNTVDRTLEHSPEKLSRTSSPTKNDYDFFTRKILRL